MSTISRRGFVSSAAALLAGAPLVHAAGQEQTISVGLIGCGGRGSGAALNAMKADPNNRLTVMCDLFSDRLAQARKRLQPQLAQHVPLEDPHAGLGVPERHREQRAGHRAERVVTPHV